jgi:hypothetical protein
MLKTEAYLYDRKTHIDQTTRGRNMQLIYPKRQLTESHILNPD